MRGEAWSAEVDCCSQNEWSSFLDLFEDANIYQTSAYGSVRWGAQNISHLVLKHDEEIAALAQVRIIRPTPLKFGMAYLKWGPVCERRGASLDPKVLERMAEALKQEYVQRRKLFLQIVPNAFEDSSRAMLFRNAFASYSVDVAPTSTAYRTFQVNIEPDLDHLRRSLDKKWRNQLCRAEDQVLTVTSGCDTAHYNAFSVLYEEMMARKNFQTSVDIREFGLIQQTLVESQRMQIYLCMLGGEPVAGLVGSAMGNTAIYLLGATGDKGLKCKGAYLLHWTFIEWLRRHNFKWYDLGGIDQAVNPNVYHFKKGLSGEEVLQMQPVTASSGASSRIAGLGYRLVRSRWGR